MLRKPTFFNTDEGVNQEISATQDSVQLGQLVLSGIGGIGLDMQNQSIVNVATPVNPSDGVTKGYVDSVAQGLNAKQSVVASATGNVANLAGTMTLDGAPVNIGDRVLLMFQTDARQNGIWVVQSGNWTRPADFANNAHAATTYVFVEEGTNYGDNGFVCNTDAPNDVIGTNNLAWTQFTGAGEIIPGSGITKSGNTVSVLLAANSGMQFTSGALDHYLTPSGGLYKDGNGLKVLLKNAGAPIATLAEDANGVSVLGVPSLFTVNGVATSANVTAPNLGTLTAGSTTQADALHTHLSVLRAQVTADSHLTPTALAAGDPVAWSSTNNQLVRGDAGVDANARIIGVTLVPAAANTQAVIVKRGVAQGVLTGATAGQPIYLGLGGGNTNSAPSGQSLRLIRLGWAVNATDLDVMPYDLGKRSA